MAIIKRTYTAHQTLYVEKQVTIEVDTDKLREGEANHEEDKYIGDLLWNATFGANGENSIQWNNGWECYDGEQATLTVPGNDPELLVEGEAPLTVLMTLEHEEASE